MTLDIVDQGLKSVAVIGEVDSSTAPLLRRRLDELGMSPRVDLSDCTFMDSSGISVLLQVHEAAMTAGGQLTLVDPSSCVIRLLTISGLLDHLPVEESPN